MNLKRTKDLSDFVIFQNLISNMPMIFYALDKNWIFTLSDGKGLNNLGLQPGQVVGINAREMYQDHPDIIRGIEEAFEGKSVQIEHALGNHYLENFIIPIYSDSGEIEGIVGATIDITERKKAEFELEKTRRLQTAIIDSVPGMLYLYDSNSELVFWNKSHETITGYSSEELDHFKLTNWYKGDLESLEAVTSGLSNIAVSGFIEGEAYLQTKEGTKLPFNFTACPLELDGAQYFVGIGLDISSRKKAQEQLSELNKTLEEKVELRTNQLKVSNEALLDANEELTTINEEMKEMNDTLAAVNEEMTAMNEELLESNNKIKRMQRFLVESEKMAALGSLVAGVAHEVNTPLGVGITASSHLVDIINEMMLKISDDTLNKIELQEYLEDVGKASAIIEKNLIRAGKLTQSFKQLSVDQTSDPIRKFNIGEYLDEILISLSPSLKKKKIKIATTFDDDIMLMGSPGAFAQIITNLVINAINHAYPENRTGTIKIGVSLENETIKIIFSDDGVGMDRQTLAKIYEPFFTTSRSHGGTGLGLSIVYTIVNQQFGGSINCESEPQKGTTFTITLSQGGI